MIKIKPRKLYSEKNSQMIVLMGITLAVSVFIISSIPSEISDLSATVSEARSENLLPEFFQIKEQFGYALNYYLIDVELEERGNEPDPPPDMILYGPEGIFTVRSNISQTVNILEKYVYDIEIQYGRIFTPGESDHRNRKGLAAGSFYERNRLFFNLLEMGMIGFDQIIHTSRVGWLAAQEIFPEIRCRVEQVSLVSLFAYDISDTDATMNELPSNKTRSDIVVDHHSMIRRPRQSARSKQEFLMRHHGPRVAGKPEFYLLVILGATPITMALKQR